MSHYKFSDENISFGCHKYTFAVQTKILKYSLVSNKELKGGVQMRSLGLVSHKHAWRP